jgi:hypothetical protein
MSEIRIGQEVYDTERCPFCNAKQGEPCGLEQYDDLGRPMWHGELPCSDAPSE